MSIGVVVCYQLYNVSCIYKGAPSIEIQVMHFYDTYTHFHQGNLQDDNCRNIVYSLRIYQMLPHIIIRTVTCACTGRNKLHTQGNLCESFTEIKVVLQVFLSGQPLDSLKPSTNTLYTYSYSIIAYMLYNKHTHTC